TSASPCCSRSPAPPQRPPRRPYPTDPGSRPGTDRAGTDRAGTDRSGAAGPGADGPVADGPHQPEAGIYARAMSSAPDHLRPDAVPDPVLRLPLRQRIIEQGLGVRAIHLQRAGHPELSHRFVEDTAENVYSISKSVTALAVGIAQDEGLLSVDDRLVDHLPAPSGGYGEGIEQVRLRHLLTMTSGSPITVFLDEQREDEDVTGLFLGTSLLTAPG